ncbi:TPA: hypothetical protein DCP18_03815 [Candidatus Wolfebacteria bacterium]|nr:hypothetical protein [Candidatus Wolfebacteria bacterium]
MLALAGGAVWGVLLVVITFLNYFSGIISGIWLAIIGNWGNIIFGILISVMMPFVYSIVALPTMLFMLPIKYFIEKNNRIATSVFALANLLYSNAIIIVWVMAVFVYFTDKASGSSSIPLLLWGYSVALAPLAYMAKEEPANSTGTAMGIFLAIISYLSLMIMWLTTGINFAVLIILAVIVATLNLLIAIPIMRREGREAILNKSSKVYED